MKRSTVTAIIPTFNRARYLADSLDSVLNQRHPPSQVIVVNDGSTDETEAVIEPYRDRVTYLAQNNHGKAAAINLALPLVEGEYLWVFDDDDVACPDALERHLAVLEREPEVGFTYSGSYWCRSDPETGTLSVEREFPVRPFADDDYFVELLMAGYTGSPAVVVRTQIQRQAGEYRTDLVRCQDMEMSLRWGLLAPAKRLEEHRPTFYRRIHYGVRGPVGQQFDYRRNAERYRAATRYILRQLHADLDLRHYLPCDRWKMTLDKASRRRALVRHFAVRLHWGLWPEAAEDLRALRDIGFERTPLTEDERGFLLRALAEYHAVDDMAASAAVIQLRSLLAAPRLRCVRRVLGRSLYYGIREQLKEDDGKEVLQTFRAAWRLLGLGGAVDTAVSGMPAKVARLGVWVK